MKVLCAARKCFSESLLLVLTLRGRVKIGGLLLNIRKVPMIIGGYSAKGVIQKWNIERLLTQLKRPFRGVCSQTLLPDLSPKQNTRLPKLNPAMVSPMGKGVPLAK